MKLIDTCPTCHGTAVRREDGSLIPHQRYADGAGYGPDQPHTMVPCEGDPEHPSHY